MKQTIEKTSEEFLIETRGKKPKYNFQLIQPGENASYKCRSKKEQTKIRTAARVYASRNNMRFTTRSITAGTHRTVIVYYLS